MIIFANKHFMPKRAKLLSLIIRFAVYFRATLSVFKRIALKTWLPLAETVVILGGIFLLKNYWAAKSGIYYPYEFMWIAVPLYVIAWMGSSWLSGAYDRPFQVLRSLQGIVLGTLFILIVYALLDEQYRYSRFLTLVGAGWAAISATSLRLIYNLLIYRTFFPDQFEQKRILIIGEKQEAERVAAVLNQSPVKTAYIGFVNPFEGAARSADYHGTIDNLKEMVEILRVNELIFCGKDILSAKIMDYMMAINHPELEYKIAPPESLFIIGSNSIQANGDLYTVGLNSVDKTENRRKKRILDLSISLFLLVFSPVYLFINKGGLGIYRNIFQVISGKKTWVGYCGQGQFKGLPKIKQGIVSTAQPFKNQKSGNQFSDQLNLLYAKDYRVLHDIEIIWSCRKDLGRYS
jgi:hypothetical protein